MPSATRGGEASWGADSDNWELGAPLGLIRRSDRGSQYASWRYGELVKDCRMTMSMSRRANAWDNAPMESFFKTLKVEQTSRCRYETRAQARLDVVDWIEDFYNRQRIHSSIEYRMPCEMEAVKHAAWVAVRENEATSLLMPGKPRRTSFPEETFTVKDRFGLDSKQEGLTRAPDSYRHFYHQPVPLAGDHR
jgi:hypothetical protein